MHNSQHFSNQKNEPRLTAKFLVIPWGVRVATAVAAAQQGSAAAQQGSTLPIA